MYEEKMYEEKNVPVDRERIPILQEIQELRTHIAGLAENIDELRGRIYNLETIVVGNSAEVIKSKGFKS